ncbi:MAG: hypothetical protein ACRC56_10965, partial [Bosea sp. (in: a-proteobacteria)]
MSDTTTNHLMAGDVESSDWGTEAVAAFDSHPSDAAWNDGAELPPTENASGWTEEPERDAQEPAVDSEMAELLSVGASASAASDSAMLPADPDARELKELLLAAALCSPPRMDASGVER